MAGTLVRSSLIDVDALAATRLRREPFDWAFTPHAIPLDEAATLLATFPTEGFWHLRGHDGEKFYEYAARPLVTLGADAPALAESLHPAWRRVSEDLCSSAYREALAALAGVPLHDALMEASVWRWGPGAQLGPHLDLPSKIATQVFYFTVGWDTAWGGCLRILSSADPDAVVEELPPRLGSASVIARSERSWHSVSPVTSSAAGLRLSLIVTWFRPGSTSPVWEVDGDGLVSCSAGGVPEDLDG